MKGIRVENLDSRLVISILFVGIYPAFISDIFTLGLEPIVASVEAIN